MNLKAKISKTSPFTPFNLGQEITIKDNISMKTGCLVVTSNETYSGWHLRPDFVTFINLPIRPLLGLSLERTAYKLKSYENKSKNKEPDPY